MLDEPPNESEEAARGPLSRTCAGPKTEDDLDDGDGDNNKAKIVQDLERERKERRRRWSRKREKGKEEKERLSRRWIYVDRMSRFMLCYVIVEYGRT